MQLPNWLSGMTGAAKFAAPGGKPNFGDAFQGIGHSMMNHYRHNFQGKPFPGQESPATKASIDSILAGLSGPAPQIQVPSLAPQQPLGQVQLPPMGQPMGMQPNWGSLAQLAPFMM